MSYVFGTRDGDSLVLSTRSDIAHGRQGDDLLTFGDQRFLENLIDGGPGEDTVAVTLHTPAFSGRAADWAIEQIDPILYGGHDTRIDLVETTLGSGTYSSVSQGLLRNVEYIQAPDGTVSVLDWPELALLAKTTPIIEEDLRTDVREDPSYSYVSLADHTVVQVLRDGDADSDSYQKFTLRALNDDGQVIWQSDPLGRGNGPSEDNEEFYSNSSNTARLTALADGGVAMIWQEMVDVADPAIDQYQEIFLTVHNADGSVRTTPVSLFTNTYADTGNLMVEQLSDGRLAVQSNARYDMTVRYVELDGTVNAYSLLDDYFKNTTDNHRLIALDSTQFMLFEDDFTAQWTEDETHYLGLQRLDGSADPAEVIRLHEFDEGLDVSFVSVARLDDHRLVVAAVTTDRQVHLLQYDDSTGETTHSALDVPYDGRHGNNLISLIEDPDGGAWLAFEAYTGNAPAGGAHVANAMTVFIGADGSLGEWFDATAYDSTIGNHYTPAVAPTASGILVTWEENGPETGRIAYNFADSYIPDPGTSGADTLTGSAGDDSVTAGAGDDLVIQSAGTDRYEGGDGFDTFRMNDGGLTASLMRGFAEASDESGTRSALTGFEAIEGGSDNDLIEGDGGDNHLSGGDGDDTFTGFGGTDTISGGAGTDTYLYSGADLAGFGSITGIELLDLTEGPLTGSDAGDLFDLSDVGGYAVSGSIEAGDGNDTVIGTRASDDIDGGRGNDLLIATQGFDTLYGGFDDGQDTLEAGLLGESSLTGGSGADLFVIHDAFDTIIADYAAYEDRIELAGDAADAAFTVSYNDDGDRELRFTETGATITFEGLFSNRPNSGRVEITGELREDATLSADISGLSDLDDIDGPRFSSETGFELDTVTYQWLRDGIAIPGATSATYTLGQADVGGRISLQVGYTDDFGTTESSTSATSVSVANVNDAPRGSLALAGQAEGAPPYAEVGTPLLADTSAISDEDGLGSFSYTWIRNGVQVSDAAQYIPTADDEGAALVLTVRYTDGHGTEERLSLRSAAVQPAAGAISGTPAGERLEGDAARNLISGLGGNDTLIGREGGDVLTGGGGDDLLLGEGFDAVYAPDEAATVFRLYQATLGRSPDATGLTNWSERLYTGERSLPEVAQGFVGSPEFQATYGALGNEGFVTLLYQNVLGRDPDATGLANWSGRLDDGMSRAQVVLGFSQSAEFREATASEARSFAQESSQAGWGDDVFRLYQATLDRAPDITGFGNWSGRLADGMALETVASSFVGSPEFQATYGALDNPGFVALLYQNVLGRAPDATGLANWSERLGDGMSRAEVVLGFSQSPEFRQATAEDLKGWIRGLDHGTGIEAQDLLAGGTGDNVLAGGLYADTFRFEQDNGGSHEVLDLEAWDHVALQGFGYADANAALLRMTQAGSDVQFSDQGIEITFTDTRLAEITDDLILV